MSMYNNVSRQASKKGIALLMVMGALMIIAIVGIELTQRSQLAKHAVVGRRDSAKALELAKAAVRWSLFRLQLDQQLDAIPVIPGTNFGGAKDDLSEVQWTFPMTYPLPVGLTTAREDDLKDDMSREEVASADSLGGSFVTSITDVSAKINLNDVGVAGPQGSKVISGPAKVLLYLLSSPRFKKYFQYDAAQNINQIVFNIDDWTDSDTQVNNLGGGAEDQEYPLEDSAYGIKNGKFYTLSEAKMISKMGLELFEELKPFITVYPFDASLPRVSSTPLNPKGKININTAPVEILAALISPQALTSNRERLSCAQKIAQARGGLAFRSISAGGTEPNFYTFLQQQCAAPPPNEKPPFIEPQVMRVLSVSSDVFEIEAVGISGNIEKTISAVVLRSSDGVKILYWKI